MELTQIIFTEDQIHEIDRDDWSKALEVLSKQAEKETGKRVYKIEVKQDPFKFVITLV